MSPFRLFEAAWGLVEVILAVLVCGRCGRASQAVAAAAPIAVRHVPKKNCNEIKKNEIK